MIGRVESTSHIERACRQVGICLKHLPSSIPASTATHEFHDGNVPWQRVINAKGIISPRFGILIPCVRIPSIDKLAGVQEVLLGKPLLCGRKV